MTPLLGSFAGAINKNANRYIGNPQFPLHPDVIRHQYKIQAVKAFETYDPQRGVQLSTHVHNQMKKASRYFIRRQNIGVIPEVRALRIREFHEGRNQLSEMLNREPNQFELSRHLRWSPMEVRRMERELRTAQATPTGEKEDEPLAFKSQREAEVIRMIQYDLGGEEKLVYEYLFGMGGKPRLQPGQIATRLRWTPSKITRIKNKIIDKIGEHI